MQRLTTLLAVALLGLFTSCTGLAGLKEELASIRISAGGGVTDVTGQQKAEPDNKASAQGEVYTGRVEFARGVGVPHSGQHLQVGFFVQGSDRTASADEFTDVTYEGQELAAGISARYLITPDTSLVRPFVEGRLGAAYQWGRIGDSSGSVRDEGAGVLLGAAAGLEIGHFFTQVEYSHRWADDVEGFDFDTGDVQALAGWRLDF